MTEAWPWLALAGLGAFHGLNPAMGWLFAVALGLHRREPRASCGSRPFPSRWGTRCRLRSWPAASSRAGRSRSTRGRAHRCRSRLIGWALYHWRYGHRHRVRFGMTDRLGGARRLVVSHGDRAWRRADAVAGADAALLSERRRVRSGAGPLWTAARASRSHLGDADRHHGGGVRRLRWIGLEILRRAWINVDLIWTLAILAGRQLVADWLNFASLGCRICNAPPLASRDATCRPRYCCRRSCRRWCRRRMAGPAYLPCCGFGRRLYHSDHPPDPAATKSRIAAKSSVPL